MTTSIQRWALVALLVIPNAGWPASSGVENCLSVPSSSSPALVSREALAVVIDLPSDAKELVTSTDSRDYLWQTSEGDVRVLFDNDPTDWPNVRRLDAGSDQSIAFFRWKTYSEKDVLLGYVPLSAKQDRSYIVEAPVDWHSCASIGRAAQMARSARLINDPSKLLVSSVEQTDSGTVATVVNELGEKRIVREGDVVTRDSGRVKSISKDRVLVKEYVWGSGWRTVALKFEK